MRASVSVRKSHYFWSSHASYMQCMYICLHACTYTHMYIYTECTRVVTETVVMLNNINTSASLSFDKLHCTLNFRNRRIR